MEENGCKMVRQIDAEKTALHFLTVNRRLVILFACTVVAIVVGFLSAIIIFTNANTKREAKILDLMAHLHGVEVTDGLYEGSN